MKFVKLALACLVFIAGTWAHAAYTVTDSCTGTTSCNLVGTHASTDYVFIFAYRAGSTTAPSLATSHFNVVNGSSSTGASRSWRGGCAQAGSTGTVSSGTWTNATNIVAFTISGTGLTSSSTCVSLGTGTVGTPNSVSSATATYSSLTMSGNPPASSIAMLLMGSSTSGQTCTPTGATVINNTGDVRASIANSTGNWTSATCSITSSVTTEIVIELVAPVIASGPSYGSPTGTYNNDVSDTASCTSSTLCATTDGSTPTATTPGTCSNGSSSSPISVTATGTTIKGICTNAGNQNSAEVDATITLQVAALSDSPGPGVYRTSQSATLSTSTTSGVIHYTTDGTTASCSSTTYSSPVSISPPQVLNALGCKTNYVSSANINDLYSLASTNFLPMMGVGNTGALAVPPPTVNTWSTSSGWSATGTTATQSCSPACGSVTIPSTVAGDLIVVEFPYDASGTAIASITGVGGSWTIPSACNAFNASTGGLACAYNVSPTAGNTSLTVTLNQSDSGGINIRSYHPSAMTAVAETVPAAVLNSNCATNCTGPTVTLTGTNDVLVAAITTSRSACSVASPFGNFASPNGDADADNLNTASGTGATFTQGNSCPTSLAGSAEITTIAFK